MATSHLLERTIRKFARRAPLDAGDRAALRDLAFETKMVEAGRYLVREGEATDSCCLIVSGFACRHKITADGDRQIVSFHIAGDFVDIEGSLLKVADHNIQTIARSEVAFIASKAIVELIDSHPRIARAMWIDTLIDASIYREWVLNLGRRPALQRIGHILCEFARRLELADLGTKDGYQFPMTQEQLADAAGLTPIHVNRTLKQLEASELIVRNKRYIEIPNWERLRAVSGFNELYLHLEQAGE